jgi:hypothetical protein
MAITTRVEVPVLEVLSPQAVDPPILRKRPDRRTLRVALGCFWLLDGLLQLQPFMFTGGFAHQIVAPAGAGQPFFVAGPVSWNAHLIAEHPAFANAIFASIQLALGFGLLLGRNARVAIVASVLWAAGVWYFGEGLGGVLGGHMTALLGAPGAAPLYVLLSCAAWPDRMETTSEPGARFRSRLPQWILPAWAIMWVGSAVLNVLPPNVKASTISSELTMNSSTAPAWLAAIDRGGASAVGRTGFGVVLVTIGAELAIGLLALGRGRIPGVALWSGIGLAILYWSVGQSFGELFSGQATDPSTGPLVVVFGFAALAVNRERQLRTPWPPSEPTPRLPGEGVARLRRLTHRRLWGATPGARPTSPAPGVPRDEVGSQYDGSPPSRALGR